MYDAVGLDAEIRALRDETERQRLAGMTNLAEHLELRGALRRDLTPERAAQILCLYHPVYHPLVVEHDWTEALFTEFLAETFVAALIRSDYVPKPLPRTKRAAELGVDTQRR